MASVLPRTGSASGIRYLYRAGSWPRMARGGRVIVVGLHDLEPEPLQRARVVAGPRPPGVHALLGGQPVLAVEGLFRIGVQRDQGAGEPLRDAGQHRHDLVFWQVDEHSVGDEEVRSPAAARRPAASPRPRRTRLSSGAVRCRRRSSGAVRWCPAGPGRTSAPGRCRPARTGCSGRCRAPRPSPRDVAARNERTQKSMIAVRRTVTTRRLPGRTWRRRSQSTAPSPRPWDRAGPGAFSAFRGPGRRAG